MKIIVTGQLKDDYFKNIEQNLISDIKKKTNFEIIELKDEKIPQNSSEKMDLQILKKEGDNILSKIKKSDYVVSLCIEGKEINTSTLKKTVSNNRDNLVFIIGGSLGLSEDVKNRSNLKISFSRMTLTHQMMRVILVDEINKSL